MSDLAGGPHVRYMMFGHEVSPAQRDRIERIGVQQWVDAHPRVVAKWIAEHEAQFAERWVDGKCVSKFARCDGELA